MLPVGICLIGFALCYINHSICGPFHATFGCTSGQLVRNSFMVAFAYPLRSLLIGVLTFLPVGIFLMSQNLFLRVSLGVLAVYYSTIYLFVFSMLKKPFQRLKDHYYASQEEDDEDEGEEE